METLTREQETAQAGVETPPERVPDAPAPTTPCATCGAPMQAGQEWCLECGTARADRLAVRPSWRSGGAVLAVTGVLVAGAVAAAWAGLSADSKRVAAEGSQAAVPPQTQQQPPAAAQPPAQTTPPAAPAPPPAKPPKPASKSTPPAAKAPAPTSATPAVPSQATPAPALKQPAKPSNPPQHDKPVAKLVAVKLADDAASTYNPYNRAGAESADPKLAIDGDRKTAWTANVDPSANGETAIGVDVDLGKATGVRSLELRTPTSGMTVEIYGARTKDAPVSVQDPDWTHITTQLDVAENGRIRLGDGQRDYRHILVWITEAPPNGQQVALGELELFE